MDTFVWAVGQENDPNRQDRGVSDERETFFKIRELLEADIDDLFEIELADTARDTEKGEAEPPFTADTEETREDGERPRADRRELLREKEKLEADRRELLREKEKLEADRRELLREKEKLEADQKDFQEEMEFQNKNLQDGQRRLKEDELFFEKKMEILKGGFAQLEADRRAVEQERIRLEAKKETEASLSVSDGNAVRLFFRGVSNPLTLKKRYRDLLKIFHPDNLCGDTQLLQEITKTYEELSEEVEWQKKA